MVALGANAMLGGAMAPISDVCVCVFSTLKVPGYREQGGGATGRGRMGTMARGDGRARAWGAGVHTGYIATAYLYIPGCTPVTSPYARPVP